MSSSVFYDLVKADEIPDAHRIESLGFPSDEAGSLETFRYRHTMAPESFFGAFVPNGAGRTLIGYVCSTLSPSLTLTHESMSHHVPSSSSVCLHSVCVSPDYRGKGVGKTLLTEYISHLERINEQDPGKNLARVLLIAHQELRGFYESIGFEWLGESTVVHGPRSWFEMRKLLTPLNLSKPSNEPVSLTSTPEFSVQPGQLPPGIWDALQNSGKNKPTASPLSSFPNGPQDVSTQTEKGSHNKFDLLCPRENCGSIILKSGVAELVERESLQLEPPDHYTSLAALPSPPATTQWWLVSPNMMAFENIGFTRPIAPDPRGPSQKRLKLLACAECDLGPLGWCEEGGSDFWLACSRVGYRA